MTAVRSETVCSLFNCYHLFRGTC